ELSCKRNLGAALPPGTSRVSLPLNPDYGRPGDAARDHHLKIAGYAFDLPVAVTHRLGAAGAIDLLRMILCPPLDLGGSSLGLGERPLGRRGEWTAPSGSGGFVGARACRDGT